MNSDAATRALTVTLVAISLFAGPSGARSARADESPGGGDSDGRAIAGHLSYVFGYKLMSREWQPARHQVDFGLVDVDLRGRSWPVSLMAELSMTDSPARPRLPGIQGDFGGSWELDLGARRLLNLGGRIRPFVGGGVCVIGASITSHGAETGGLYYTGEWDRALGSWAEVGFYAMTLRQWGLGLRLAHSHAMVELAGNRLDAGGTQTQMMFVRNW